MAPGDGAHRVEFIFEGDAFSGFSGEPIAAALFRAGVRVFRTMPTSGEARGGYCLVGRCSDCMVVVDGTPNVRACVTPLRAGMEIQVQRGFGEGAWDRFGVEAVQ